MAIDAGALRILRDGLSYFGAATLIYCVLNTLAAVFKILIQPGTSVRKFGPKGSWALITGASDGIGKEFAYQLAAKGFGVILISRTESKLAEITSDIRSKYQVQAEYLPIDFAKNSDGDYKKIEQFIQGKDISILINNVGKSHDMPVDFLATEQQEMEDIININIFATLRVTRIVAPTMVERKRGLILTMGSFAGLLPTPLLATYSGSKAFLSHWSAALSAELKPKGIHVDLVNSYLVTSAMSKVRRSSVLIPTPKAFVKAALNKVGVYVGGTTGVVTPFWTHAAMHWAIETFVGIGSSIGLDVNKRMHEDIRKRALRKKEREAKSQ